MSQSKFCENCGAPLAADVRFCESCGQPVATAAPAAAPAGPHMASTAAPPPPAEASARGPSRRLVIGLAGIAGLLVIAVVAVVALRSPREPREGAATPTVQPVAASRETAAPTGGQALTPQTTVAPSPAPATAIQPSATPLIVASATPTRTPTPTQTVTPTSAPTNTPTPTPTALFEDAFVSKQASEAQGWTFRADGQVEPAWSANQLVTTVKANSGLLWGFASGDYADLGLEAEMQFTSGASSATSLVFRYSEAAGKRSYYSFGINTAGEYFLDRMVSGAAQRLVNSTRSTLIKSGQGRNTLGVIATGSSLTLYINRTLVKTVTDTAVGAQGKVGFIVYSDKAPAVVAYSRFTIYTPDQARQAWSPTATPIPTSGELKVAILAPLSGDVPDMGVMARDGALLAIAEWNARGGVLGKKIVPVVEDSRCDPTRAVSAANKVIDQDKVKFIIGESCSNASIPISEIANAKKVIQISPTSSNASVTVADDGKTKDYVFRACFTARSLGKMGAKFAIDELKAKTAFILLNEDDDWVKGLAESFEMAFTLAGGKVVDKLPYSADDRNFNIPLAKVAAAKPDIIYLPDYSDMHNLVTKQAKANGITTPFVGGDGWDMPDLDVKAAAGSFFTTEYSPKNPRAEVQAFIKAFGSSYKDDKGGAKAPDWVAALAYDATNLLLEGIKQAGADDTAQVKAALERIQFNGLSGKTTFDAQHNPVKPAIILAVTDTGVQFKSVVNP